MNTLVLRATLAALLAAACAAPAAAAEPICHGQFAPLTPEQEEQARIQEYMRDRAQFGFRADEAYVRELIRRGVWEDDVGSIPVTPRENDYLRLRAKLRLGRKAEEYLRRHRGLSGGWSIEDDWPRGPYVLVHLTRNRAAHERALERLVPFPRHLRTDRVRYSERRLRRLADRIGADAKRLRRAGFRLSSWGADIATNTAHVDLITRRTDAAAYFTRRYGPVTVAVIATRPTSLQCEPADAYELSEDGRWLTIHWTRSGSAKLARIEVVEHDDRVEIGVIDRVPNGPITLDAAFDHHRVHLSRPLGDRKVIDTATGKRLRRR